MTNKQLNINTIEDIDSKTIYKRPKMWKVIFIDDDDTPTDFIEEILQIIFRKNIDEIEILTERLYHDGSVIIGIYTYEIAETKMGQSMYAAVKKGYPLQVQIEPEE